MRLTDKIMGHLLNFTRRIRLTPKMLILTLLVGFIVWTVLDTMQTKMLKEMSNDYIDKILEGKNREHRMHFDNYVELYHSTAKLIVLLKPFQDHAAGLNAHLSGKHSTLFHSEIPPWLPSASVMRHLVHIHYALLLDRKGSVREIYQDVSEPLPHALLEPSGLLRQLSHNQSYMTSVEGAPFLLTSESLTGADGDVKATLMLAAGLDDDFLRCSQSANDENELVALIEKNKHVVISSNRPELLPAGTPVERLGKDYKITGKSFFDWGSSDLILELATLVSKSEFEQMGRTILRSERRQRSILAFLLILSFLLIIFAITRRIEHLMANISDFSEKILGIRINGEQKGDELDLLEDEFRHLTVAIIEARDIVKKQAEILLSEKTVYLNSIMKSSPFAIAATDLDFVIRYYNPVAEKFFGHKAEDVIGRTVPHIHEKLKVDPSRFERAIEIVKRNNLYTYNVKTTTGSGTLFLESRVSGIWDEKGELIGFVLMSSDVTSKLKAEEELKAMAKFPDENPYPVLRLSQEGLVLYSNQASSPLMDLWGCRPTE
ncbi:MAG: PAS domain S-box protein, partial [Nitrospirae bacterium]|nr:PAS domain S-box protein [Nitrospirota bacterium]